MYGKYNVETLDKVIDTVNCLHHHHTELESVFQSTELGHIDDVMEAIYFGCEVWMYTTFRKEELAMCKSICYTYYCEEFFVVKHKSKHSCDSAIFYDIGPKVVAHNCHFNY